MPNARVPVTVTGLPTRRATFAALAGLGAALALPKTVSAAEVAPLTSAAEAADPIFAAIEKHRAADAAHNAAVALCAPLVDPPDHLEAARAAASDAEQDARYDMHETVPQTVAGLAAYVAYWDEYVGPPEGCSFGCIEEIGWEAIPTIAEAMATLFPITRSGGAA